MKALILCGGLGKRLGNSANGTPKPLVDIGGKPCLYYTLIKLQRIGVSELVLNTHYKPSYFKEFTESFDFNMEIKLSYEPELLGTAGTLKKHLNWLNSGNFWVMHGDNIFDDDLLTLHQKIEKSNRSVIGGMGVFWSKNHNQVGIVRKNLKGRFVRIYEKKDFKHGYLANAATYYFKPEISQFVRILKSSENDISIHLLPKLARKLQVIKLQGSLIDIGTPESLTKARESFNTMTPGVKNLD
jgi:mannose-1-phosphate guanylyltransferase